MQNYSLKKKKKFVLFAWGITEKEKYFVCFVLPLSFGFFNWSNKNCGSFLTQSINGIVVKVTNKIMTVIQKVLTYSMLYILSQRFSTNTCTLQEVQVYLLQDWNKNTQIQGLDLELQKWFKTKSWATHTLHWICFSSYTLRAWMMCNWTKTTHMIFCICKSLHTVTTHENISQFMVTFF